MELKNDLMKGAARIAEYADVDERSVYHWADMPEVPVFRVGRALYARRSQLDGFFTWAPPDQQNAVSSSNAIIAEPTEQTTSTKGGSEESVVDGTDEES